ncbi:hypothetical protein FJQ54_05565 [Sandaracinobacter neustonicus]|uniref:Exo-alpha-sialidase n=2 Tax=Sandaracinobacter neustonicus TaxID=1715348 RepID=A0A501XQ87_9SPHN|nr:hypothetical protein FJQ54_05565 [Sandaracinobacter neustonicus]
MGERLAADPANPDRLFFGSRHDGLWRSDDAGTSWARVEGFPWKGLGQPAKGQTHGGVSFVLFAGAAIYAGVTDPGAPRLLRSTDGGQSWQAVAGGPPADLLPVKAVADERGRLFIAYSDQIGPSGITRGAIWRSDGAEWADVTPQRHGGAGYMGLSAGHGLVAVGTIGRWQPDDTVWLSRNGGNDWDDLAPRSRRDVSAVPFLKGQPPASGDPGPEFGHWIAGVLLDPARPGRLAYVTGATIYATNDARAAGELLWKPWVEGIEQTAIITLASPTAGPPLLSGFGDIAGFVHSGLLVSPQPSFFNPFLSNTNNLDYAGRQANIWVRSGSLWEGRPRDATLAWSDDGGFNWQPLKVPPAANGKRDDLEGSAPIHVSADGGVFIVCTPVPLRTADRGQNWGPMKGVAQDDCPVGDKRDPQRFYALRFNANQIVASTDGGQSFRRLPAVGLPPELWKARTTNREAPRTLVANPLRVGDLWLRLGEEIWHSPDGGRRFRKASGAMKVQQFGLGRPRADTDPATLFVIGTLGGVYGIWRSADEGRNWLRLNDDAHQWGRRFRVISGDPRQFGRVYVGTDGRGIVWRDSD